MLRSDAFASGVEELGKHGLHFEFCVHADRLPAVVDAVAKCPGTRYVLNHCGLNDSGVDFEAWQAAIAALAAFENVSVKLSAVEEWKPRGGDPAPYLDFALAKFGPQRCMYGGNWFVPLAFDKPYGATFDLVTSAVDRLQGLSDAEREAAKDAIFCGTATRVYQLAETTTA